MNPLERLWHDGGQAVWLDSIGRQLVEGGGLARLVADDGVRGVTSNPSIFNGAIAGTGEYDTQVAEFLRDDPKASADELYEALVVRDIRAAADVLRPLYESSERGDGYVSLEVAPGLAHDTEGTIAEARRLWAAVDRPNLMIKVPATPEGIPAIEALIAAGVNVNVTLMFSLQHYEAVARAFLAGLERAADPERVASVASFFVSRVDSAVDTRLEADGSEAARALLGRAAIANACLAYRRFREIFHGAGFEALRARGARPQRPLWASTSTKNPAYPDTMYVTGLIAPETVNTLPAATLDAFRDHGEVVDGLERAMETADEVMAGLAACGIDLDEVTEELQRDGVRAFADAFDQLMASLEAKRAAAVGA